MSGVTVVSLFDGMRCGRLALQRAGIPVARYYASEIDQHAIKVATANWPQDTNLGDVTKWREWDIDWSKVDFLIGGSPCQGFSAAGKQGGTKATLHGQTVVVDTRELYHAMKRVGAEFESQSHLFWEFVLCLDHAKAHNPKVKFLLENVKMSKANMQLITDAMGVEPVFINSSLVSAQNRQRWYWCNWQVDQPKDKGITWGDVKEKGVSDDSFYYTDKALQWLARHSRRTGKHLTVHQRSEKMQMVEMSHHKKYSSQRFFGICDVPHDLEAVASMRGRRIDPATMKRVDSRTDVAPVQHIEFRYDGKSNCLSTVEKDNVVVPFTLPNRIPADMFFFRYITPTECERLQTVPDGYTDHVSNTQRYRMLGNGWTVDVIAHIFSELKGPCAKQKVTAVLVDSEGNGYVGENDCLNPQAVCPREIMRCKTGEGYELCQAICKQTGHAEQNAIALAGDKAKGGIIYLQGHTYACDSCKQAASDAGVKDIVII